ncbi:DegT/DnrJ/EryC1/StrS family aminotransferase, partial [Providencia stuartii]
LWQRYYEALSPLAQEGKLALPIVPEGLVHNAHMFYIKLKDVEERTAFNEYMKSNGVLTVFHYVALHTSPAGEEFGRFHGEDRYTTSESDRLVRLPMFYNMTDDEQQTVIAKIKAFFA